MTVAIALPIQAMLGSEALAISLAAAMISCTGFCGANCGRAILDLGRISDPIARGIAMGSSAHGLGAASLVPAEPAAFAFGALSYATCGTLAAVLVAIPPFKGMLLQI